jgi:hypothetical protein
VTLPPPHVAEQARAWLSLRAWGGGLPIRVSPISGKQSTGTVRLTQGWAPEAIEINIGWDAADAYATILHELAHVFYGGAHGKRWRNAYLLAVAEVAGIDVSDLAAQMPQRHTRTAVDRLARRAMADLIRKGKLFA